MGHSGALRSCRMHFQSHRTISRMRRQNRHSSPDSDLAFPIAQRGQVLTEELPEGLLLYDLTRNRAHSLNPAAALVWRHSDGITSVSNLARLLHEQLGLPQDEDLVWLAIKRLEAAHLLVETPKREVTRRQLLKKLTQCGLALIVLPAVTSILAATPAYAANSTGIFWQTVLLAYKGPHRHATITFTAPGKVMTGIPATGSSSTGLVVGSFTFLEAHTVSVTATGVAKSPLTFGTFLVPGDANDVVNKNCAAPTTAVTSYVFPSQGEKTTALFFD